MDGERIISGIVLSLRPVELLYIYDSCFGLTHKIQKQGEKMLLFAGMGELIHLRGKNLVFLQGLHPTFTVRADEYWTNRESTRVVFVHSVYRKRFQT